MELIMICSLVMAFVSIVAPLHTAIGETYFGVTLHVFSGTRDPQWRIDHSNRNFSMIRNGVIGHNSTPLASRLGYSGFTIDIFSDGVLSRTLDVGRCTRSTFETLLFETVKDIPPEGTTQPLSDAVKQYVRDDIQSCQ